MTPPKTTIYVMIIVMCLFCSCVNKTESSQVSVSPLEKNIIDLSTRLYEEAELLEIAEFNGSLQELNDHYPIECLREVNDLYRVSYWGNNHVAVLCFDNSENWLWGKVYSVQRVNADFDNLIKGQSSKEVMTMDPDGEYVLFYVEREDVSLESTHYTKDGYIVTIKYDTARTIISINQELI